MLKLKDITFFLQMIGKSIIHVFLAFSLFTSIVAMKKITESSTVDIWTISTYCSYFSLFLVAIFTFFYFVVLMVNKTFPKILSGLCFIFILLTLTIYHLMTILPSESIFFKTL